MKKQFFVVLFLALTIGYFSGCEKKSTPDTTTGPKENEFIITGKVTRSDTQAPVSDAVVGFITQSPVATRSNDSGYYGFSITTDVVYTAKLFATKEGVGTSDTLEVTVYPQRQVTQDIIIKAGGPARISGPATSIVLLSTSEDNISVKGTGANESSQLVFEVRDSSGVAVNIENKTNVTFGIQGGPNGGEFVSPHSKDTDSSGRVAVTLGAGTKPGVLQVFAEATVGTRQLKSSPVSVSIVGGLPDAAHFTLGSNIPVNIVWPITGDAIGQINVQVGDKFGNPARPGTPVYFSASAGVIIGSAQTDLSGKVSVTWSGGNPPPSENGLAYITANTIGENGTLISDTLRFEFGKIVLPHRPGAASITLVSISRQELSVRGAGTNESADIVFEIRDSSGVPVGLSNRVTVVFTLQGGLNGGEYLTPESVETDTAGRVKTTINSGTKAGVVQISATVQVGSAVIRSSQVTLTISGGAPDRYHFSMTSNVVSNIDWPKAGTIIGTIKVQIGDKYGNPVQQNTSVYFSTSAGVIQGTAYTSRDGLVDVNWLAGNPPPTRDGGATVTATVVGENGSTITDSLMFIFTGPAISGGEARVILFVSATNTLLSVDEAAGPQSSEVTFEVRDSLGLPVNQSHQAHVRFSLANAPEGSYLSPQYVNTDPQTGRAKTNVIAGTKSGPIQLLAELTTSTGIVVRSMPVQLQISGGLPDQAHFSIATTRLNIPAWYFVNRQTEIVALVGDKYSNPTRPKTAVYFSTTGGVIENNEAFTDNYGLATIQHISGAPWPTDNPLGAGYTTITGRTVDGNGIQISEDILVLLSGGAVLKNITMYDEIRHGWFPFDPSIHRFHIPSGGSATFQFDLTDQNNNPLSEGTTFTKDVGFIPPPLSSYIVSVSGVPKDPLPDMLFGGTHYRISINDNTVGGTPAKWSGYIDISVQAPFGTGRYTTAGMSLVGDIADTTYHAATMTVFIPEFNRH
jgi:hypothetical protein